MSKSHADMPNEIFLFEGSESVLSIDFVKIKQIKKIFL